MLIPTITRPTCYRYNFSITIIRGRSQAADSLPISLREVARHGRARLLAEDSAKVGVKALGDWFYRFKIHALIHWPTQMVSAAMLLPGNRSDQVAAPALARSTSGGVLLADRGYRGSDLFDCPCATTGRAPGHPAGRKQLFGPLAPVHRSSLRPVLARPTGKPAAEGVPLQSGASRHRVPTR
ncbi:transposase [Salinibacter ruber]|uniref:transposase n=1 Tax=Salinibacter ruber TaxID=146919 RepID=UPI003C6E4C7E